MSIRKKKVIIVGGGTAGSVVARKLSSKYEVLVIDKSKNKKIPPLYRVPLMIGLLFASGAKYVNKSKLLFSKSRSVPFYESKLIGGASVINGCVHVVGNTNAWERILTQFGLSIDDLQESYRELFTKKKETGKIQLSVAKQDELENFFFSTLVRFGIDRGDTEWADNKASGLILNTFKRFFRSSVLDLNPFPKSKIIENCKIENLVVDKELRILGVSDGRTIYKADCVILCAGVIDTNSILLRKAICVNDGTLVDLGFDAGQGVQDHTNLRINVEASKAIDSLNVINSSLFKKTILVCKHLLGQKTLMSGTGASATANLDINGDDEIDTRINLLRFYESGRMGSNGKLFSRSLPGFSISITHINPKSKGEIALSKTGINVKPNYLSEPSDISHLEKSVKFVVDLLESEPFSHVVKKIENLDLIKSDPQRYILDNSYSGYHLIGGCANLIDANFKLKAHKNLFACDASVLSEYPSSNIHSTVVILADLFAKRFMQLI